MTKTPTTEEDYVYKIEEPVMSDLFEPEIDVIDADFKELSERGFNTTYDLRRKIADETKKEGFDAGAVIVLRRGNEQARIKPENWGIVLEVITWSMGASGYYAPIKVNWLDGVVSHFWPDQLIVVNYPPDDIELGQIRRGEA